MFEFIALAFKYALLVGFAGFSLLFAFAYIFQLFTGIRGGLRKQVLYLDVPAEQFDEWVVRWKEHGRNRGISFYDYVGFSHGAVESYLQKRYY